MWVRLQKNRFAVSIRFKDLIMWYFIHIPKCAGRFIQEELGLRCGHTYHNEKLFKYAPDSMYAFSLADDTNDNISLYKIENGALQLDVDLVKNMTTHERNKEFTFLDKKHPQSRVSPYPSIIEKHVKAVHPINGDPQGVGPEFHPDDPKAKKEFTEITKEKTFTIVRNPFSWLASYYCHNVKGETPERGWGNSVNVHGFESFKEFVVHYCTCKSSEWHEPCFNRFMAFQIFDKNDEVLPKYIIYKERMNEGIKEYLDHKIIGKKDTKQFKEYDYRKMYDNEMIDLVSKKMKHELKLFNYDFEGPKGNGAGLVDLKHKYDIIKNKHYYRN